MWERKQTCISEWRQNERRDGGSALKAQEGGFYPPPLKFAGAKLTWQTTLSNKGSKRYIALNGYICINAGVYVCI